MEQFQECVREDYSPFSNCVISDSDDDVMDISVPQPSQERLGNNCLNIDSNQNQIENSNESQISNDVHVSSCQLINFPKMDFINCLALRDSYTRDDDNTEEFRNNLYNKVTLIKKKWFYQQNNDLHSLNVLQLALRNFEILDKKLTRELISMGSKKCQFEAVSLFYQLSEKKIMTDEIKRDMDHIFELIYHSAHLIEDLFCYKRALSPNYETYVCDELAIYRFTPPDSSKNTPFQNLILYLLNTIYKKKFRRYPPSGETGCEGDKYCYREIYTKSGYYTYAWKRETSIEKFVYKSCQKELNYEQWHNLTVDKTNGKNVISFLSITDDHQFLELRKNRHVFSFTNGVYIAKNYDSRTDIYSDRFYKYGTYPALPSDTVASKYFNYEFNMFEELDIDDWYTIPTPFLQSILDFQFKDEDEYEEICKWMYILIGRMLYQVGDLDDWQVIGFIKGLAGTGKGTILTKIIKQFYEPDDVGILSNDGESTFGVSGFYDKLIFIAPEVKGDIKLPQAQFQGMVSGEDIVVSVKYKTPQNLVWKTPGMLAGNETPNYTDNSGSLSRRLLIFTFMNKVPKKCVDPLLGKKLKLEIPYILKKVNIAYLDAVNKYGKKSIWEVVPKYFIKNQQELTRNTNALMSFLDSGLVEYGNDMYVRETVFKNAFNTFCKENNFKKCKYNKDLYSLPFANSEEKHDVKIGPISRRKLKYPRNTNNTCHGTFITGMVLSQEEDPAYLFKDTL
jgi:hypothetical protein